jgi:hypothetical protein
VSDNERKAKRAAHAREVYAQQAAERAAAAAKARAEAEAAHAPDVHQLNRWLAEEDGEPCDRDEWDAFEQYTMDSQDVAGFDELDEEDLEKEVFSELFLSWRQSDEYKQYHIENEINEMDNDNFELVLPMTPAEVRQKHGPRQPSPPPPDDGDDPWGGGSADCYYEGFGGMGQQAAP